MRALWGANHYHLVVVGEGLIVKREDIVDAWGGQPQLINWAQIYRNLPDLKFISYLQNLYFEFLVLLSNLEKMKSLSLSLLESGESFKKILFLLSNLEKWNPFLFLFSKLENIFSNFSFSSRLDFFASRSSVIEGHKNVLPSYRWRSLREREGWQALQPVIDEMQKSPIEKRKRNLKTISPHSRGEREIWIPFHQFREEKEKSESLCLVSRGEREISNFLAQVREEKEKPEFISPVSRGEREISNSFAQFREEKEKLANISNFREEKFKTKFLYGYIHLRE